MKITVSWLAERGACVLGKEWFEARFPGGGDAETVGSALVAEKRWHYAQWFAEKVAETDPAAAKQIAAKTEDAYWHGSASRNVGARSGEGAKA